MSDNNKPSPTDNIDDYLKEDIEAFTDHLQKNENLYNELHSIFHRTTQGSMAFGATRDMAELGRTLSSVRSTGIEAVNKRFSAKKSIIELKQKERALNKDANENIEAGLAKALIKEIRESRDTPLYYGSGSTQLNHRNDDNSGREMLDARVNDAIDGGRIQFTSNDKAMVQDFKGVDYRYDNDKQNLIAVDRNSGEAIDNYPIERIPRVKISRVENGVAMSENGQTFKIQPKTKRST